MQFNNNISIRKLQIYFYTYRIKILNFNQLTELERRDPYFMYDSLIKYIYDYNTHNHN